MTREQITAIRKTSNGAICLFHVGDFYEAYEDDAEFCAKTLGLTLTSRAPKGQPV